MITFSSKLGKSKAKQIQDEIVQDELLRELLTTQQELYSAYADFENVIDPDLIDSCIYQLKAAQLKYKFLLNRVKSEEKYLMDS